MAEALSARGASLALAARRRPKVEALASRLGNGAVALKCDVCDEDSSHRVVDAAAEALGGLDAVVYTPAILAMSMLMDADAQFWDEAFRTNVTGAALVTQAAVPHLREGRGRILYLSSVSASGPPWPGLGVYIASKAALERMVEAWRAEHSEVLFTCLSLGTIWSDRDPDDFPAWMTTERAMKVIGNEMPQWGERGLARPPLPDSKIADQVASILASDADIERITIQAPW